jgi:hypothetical protein
MADRRVVPILNDGFVPVSIDVDRHEQLAKQMRIESVPTVLILSPEGRVLQRVTGFQSPTQLLQRIEPLVRVRTRLQEGLPPARRQTTRSFRN